MTVAKKPVNIKILTGKEAEAVRQQRYEDALAQIAQRIQDKPFSEEEIAAEVKAFREGK